MPPHGRTGLARARWPAFSFSRNWHVNDGHALVNEPRAHTGQFLGPRGLVEGMSLRIPDAERRGRGAAFVRRFDEVDRLDDARGCRTGGPHLVFLREARPLGLFDRSMGRFAGRRRHGRSRRRNPGPAGPPTSAGCERAARGRRQQSGRATNTAARRAPAAAPPRRRPAG